MRHNGENRLHQTPRSLKGSVSFFRLKLFLIVSSSIGFCFFMYANLTMGHYTDGSIIRNLLLIPLTIALGLLSIVLYRIASSLKPVFFINAMIALVAADQIIKLCLQHNNQFMKPYPVIPSWFYFINFPNPFSSGVGALLGVKLPINAFLQIAMGLCTLIIYRFLFVEFTSSRHLSKSYLLFAFSGGLSYFLDLLIRKTSLDYFLIKGFMIFDLKDIYLLFSLIFLLNSFIPGPTLRRSLEIIKEASFMHYCLKERDTLVRLVNYFKNPEKGRNQD